LKKNIFLVLRIIRICRTSSGNFKLIYRTTEPKKFRTKKCTPRGRKCTLQGHESKCRISQQSLSDALSVHKLAKAIYPEMFSSKTIFPCTNNGDSAFKPKTMKDFKARITNKGLELKADDQKSLLQRLKSAKETSKINSVLYKTISKKSANYRYNFWGLDDFINMIEAGIPVEKMTRQEFVEAKEVSRLYP
jgi:hypothetical protein